MEARHGSVVLFLVFVVRHVTSTFLPQIDTDLLSSLNLPVGKPNPVIVFVNAPKTQKSKDSNGEFDDLFITGDDGIDDDNFVYETEAKEQAKYLLYNYLKAPSEDEEEDPDDIRPALRQALRARCQAKVQCESKCKTQNREKEYCPMNCKAIFDQLDMCDPPKQEGQCNKSSCNNDDSCGNSNSCGKRGKTMPPKWFRF